LLDYPRLALREAAAKREAEKILAVANHKEAETKTVDNMSGGGTSSNPAVASIVISAESLLKASAARGGLWSMQTWRMRWWKRGLLSVRPRLMTKRRVL